MGVVVLRLEACPLCIWHSCGKACPRSARPQHPAPPGKRPRIHDPPESSLSPFARQNASQVLFLHLCLRLSLWLEKGFVYPAPSEARQGHRGRHQAALSQRTLRLSVRCAQSHRHPPTRGGLRDMHPFKIHRGILSTGILC